MRLKTHCIRLLSALGVTASCAMTLTACKDPQVLLPASLQGPVSMDVARGDVCLRLSQISDEGLLGARIDACRTPEADSGVPEIVRERGAIGLVANMNENRLAVMALDRDVPALVDLDLATPGVNHITVGRRPMDVGVSPDGTVAYTMNQLDQDISVVNLWAMRAQPVPIKLEGIPAALEVHPRTGYVVTGIVSPRSSLQIHGGVRCAAPENLPVEVGQIDPSSDCEGAEEMVQTLPLEGAFKDVALAPTSAHAYVIYTDRAWMSVIALDEEARAGEPCLEGGVAPCEVARIGLTFECSDGLDNDDDGLTDAQDVQCFGPLGAESQGGVGVRTMSACANGLDDDGDGLLDRDDPECRVASQGSESAEDAPAFDDIAAVCGDGADNDGDGLIDALDPDCYGAHGQRESTVDTPGLIDISVDEHGIIAYILNPLTSSVLAVDLRGRRLLQPSKIAGTTDPFSELLGVPISRTVAPTAVRGTINRRVTRDPRIEYAASHALITYDLGAYVTGDNGFLYFVEAATVSCDVWETQGLMDESTFFMEPWRLADFQESRCLVVPVELRSDQVDVAPSCEEFLLCRECVRERADVEACTPCDRYREQDVAQGVEDETQGAYQRAGEVCGLEERIEKEGLLTRVFNPRFTVRDANAQADLSLTGGLIVSASSPGVQARTTAGQDATQLGSAQCVQPEALVVALNQAIQNNPMGSQVAGCGSPLLQQPLSVTIPTRGASALDDYITVQRIDLPEQRFVRLLMTEVGEVFSQLVVDTEDFVIREQEWSITYEGVLPGTRRGDGLITQTEGELDIGTLDPCVSDVRVGDALIIRSEPGSTTGGVPAGCEAFATPATSTRAWREYEVLDVREDSLVFGLAQDIPGVVGALPREECFARGIEYEVRARGEWLVTGSMSGIASGQIARDGVCVPGHGADAPRVQSRVQGGQRFVGPGISFWMTQGVVAPVRDASYLVGVARNFSAASTPSGLSINVSTPAPTEVHFERLYSAAPQGSIWPQDNSRKQLILVVEPADNLIITREPIFNEDSNVVR